MSLHKKATQVSKKHPKRTTSDYASQWEPSLDTQACAYEDCDEEGHYRAPKSRTPKDGYHWFCLEHVREYNMQWDYLKGLTPAQIEQFIQSQIIGERPTRRFRDMMGMPSFRDPLHMYESFRQGKKEDPKTPSLAEDVEKALTLLELTWPIDEKELKKKYKALAKRLHPDLNPGNPKAGEQFKDITIAYATLLAVLQGY